MLSTAVARALHYLFTVQIPPTVTKAAGALAEKVVEEAIKEAREKKAPSQTDLRRLAEEFEEGSPSQIASDADVYVLDDETITINRKGHPDVLAKVREVNER